MALGPKPAKKVQKEPSLDALICASGEIFDPKALSQNLKAWRQSGIQGDDLRKQAAAFMRERNKVGRAAIETAFGKSPWAAAKVVHSYCYLTDQIVKAIYRVATELAHPNPTPTKTEALAIIAVGGYGRAEMAPFSDVDLLFLSPYKLSPWSENVVETMMYILWDTRLKIGHSTRSIDECVTLGSNDQTIKTALLESRFITGRKKLANALEKKLWSRLFSGDPKQYVEEKLKERAKRHSRQGQRYMQEPNVKEGKGGLRDLQTLYWITKHISGSPSLNSMIEMGYFSKKEFERFEEAHAFLWTVRCHLHLITGRASEQLTFDAQIELAERLGYQDSDGLRGVERFMQDYFLRATHVGELTRIFLTALEDQHVKDGPSIGTRLMRVVGWNRTIDDTPDGYKLVHNRLDVADEQTFLSDPLNIMRLFEEALKSDILIHPNAMRLVVSNLHLIDDDLRASPEAQRIFIDLLLSYGNPERALRRMNELGVLGAFIPEFKRIVAMMQFNVYHHYTVDEHTIQCISNLAQLERGELKEDLPVLTEVFKGKIDRKVLYIALLLHDIGKGLPEDHSIAGAKIAQDVCPRLGLSPKDTETIVWLVRNHLLMSDMAQKRDVSDTRTVLNFAKIVKTNARLNLLIALSVCDIRGVGPETWNNWKAQLFRTLYWSTKSTINAGIDKVGVYNRLEEAKSALSEQLSDWPKPELEHELQRHYDPYWQGLDQKSHVSFANLLRDLKDQKLVSEIEPDQDRDATRACFVMQDHPGIFSRIAGALALASANVVDARTYTSSDGFATSIFWIQDDDGNPFATSRIPRLRSMIEKTLLGEVIARQELKGRDKFNRRERDFLIPTEIDFDNQGSELYTIIEVDTRDRPGLLFDLTRTLSDANIYIASAVIATYGVQAVDVFYVKDMFGLKIHSEDKQKQIAAKLTAAIELGTKGAMS